MLFLKVLTALLGIAFTAFGYFIYFRKKYSLINGFADAYRNGTKIEAYAKRVGLVELVTGIVVLIVAIISFGHENLPWSSDMSQSKKGVLYIIS